MTCLVCNPTFPSSGAYASVRQTILIVYKEVKRTMILLGVLIDSVSAEPPSVALCTEIGMFSNSSEETTITTRNSDGRSP